MLVGYTVREEGRKDVCVMRCDMMWGYVGIGRGGAEEESELGCE